MLSLPDFREKQIVICFAKEGQKVSFKNDNLVIKDSKDTIIIQTSCHRILSLWIVGHSTITTGILQRSRTFGFSIYLLSHGHRLYGCWNSSTEGNFLLRRLQYQYNSILLPRHLVHNKITNQAHLLQHTRNKDSELKDVIAIMQSYSERAATATDIQALLGLEGSASRLFFSHWFKNLNWNGRKPRTKINPVNTLLDIGYTYLFNFIESMLNLYGFDLYQGVYHKCFYQRKSLVCDMVEPFRCIIDKQIKKAYQLKQFQFSDFKKIKEQYLLKIEKNKTYTQWITKTILEYKENIFNYIREYYRCFIRQKDIQYYPEFAIV